MDIKQQTRIEALADLSKRMIDHNYDNLRCKEDIIILKKQLKELYNKLDNMDMDSTEYQLDYTCTHEKIKDISASIAILKKRIARNKKVVDVNSLVNQKLVNAVNRMIDQNDVFLNIDVKKL